MNHRCCGIMIYAQIFVKKSLANESILCYKALKNILLCASLAGTKKRGYNCKQNLFKILMVCEKLKNGRKKTFLEAGRHCLGMIIPSQLIALLFTGVGEK